jgi:hypothetical protein
MGARQPDQTEAQNVACHLELAPDSGRDRSLSSGVGATRQRCLRAMPCAWQGECRTGILQDHEISDAPGRWPTPSQRWRLNGEPYVLSARRVRRAKLDGGFPGSTSKVCRTCAAFERMR